MLPKELYEFAVMVLDSEELIARKGNDNHSCEEENQKNILFDHVPRKARSARRCVRPNFENGNRRFSAWSLSPPCSSILLLLFENNTCVDKKMEMKNTLNPNSESSPSSCYISHKRREVSQELRNVELKRAKVPSSSRTAREIACWIVQVMKEMNGEEPRMVFEKTLTKTDVDPGQGRFLIPFNGLRRNDFLTLEEWGIIINGKNTGVRVMVVDPMSRTWNVILKIWEMKKKTGKRCLNYSLISGWNLIVKANELKEGHNIGVWSFRSGGILCLALVRLPLN